MDTNQREWDESIVELTEKTKVLGVFPSFKVARLQSSPVSKCSGFSQCWQTRHTPQRLTTVSIRAPREGGDEGFSSRGGRGRGFNPRPP